MFEFMALFGLLILACGGFLVLWLGFALLKGLFKLAFLPLLLVGFLFKFVLVLVLGVVFLAVAPVVFGVALLALPLLALVALCGVGFAVVT
jgi:hypothetical protein